MQLNLIDGSAYIHRAFHAVPPLQTRDGRAVGALHGFCDTMLYLLKSREHTCSHVAVVLDAGRSGRDKVFPAYKSERKPRPLELITQIKALDDACAAFSVPTVRVAGCEADDVMAGLALQFRAQGGSVVMYTSDKDMMQLVSDDILQYCPLHRKFFGPADVYEKWGVNPAQIADMLGLMGDAIDGIPGVPNIGKGTAAQLIQKHGSLEGAIEAALTGKASTTTTRMASLKHNADLARLSRNLAVLLPDVVAAGYDFKALEVQPRDYRKLLDFFEDLEFDQLAEKAVA